MWSPITLLVLLGSPPWTQSGLVLFDNTNFNETIVYMKNIFKIVVNFVISLVIAFMFWYLNYLFLNWGGVFIYVFFIFYILVIKIILKKHLLLCILLGIPLSFLVIYIIEWVGYDYITLFLFSLISTVIVYPIYTKHLKVQ